MVRIVDYLPGKTMIDKDRKRISLQYDYDYKAVTRAAELFAAISGKHRIREMESHEFGPMTQARFFRHEYNQSQVLDSCVTLYSDGTILVATLSDAAYISEESWESASTTYLIFTPKPKPTNEQSPRAT